MKALNIKSVVKYSFKSVLILSCVGGILLTTNVSSALAANAIVTSDPELNFDNKKLEANLTNISNKSGLNVVFYSNNTLSPNTVTLPNGTTVNKAVYLNDNFIGSIKSNDYITLVYNKDSSNVNRGSFSVNVGANYRSVIDKEYITKEIVDPKKREYLPQSPEEFIPVVSQLIVDRINNVNNWNRTVGIGITLTIWLLIFAIIYFVIKYLIETFTTAYKNAEDVYENTSKSLQQLESVYKGLVVHDPYLKGYQGQTGERAARLQADLDLVILDKEYSLLLAMPPFKYCLFGTSRWINYCNDVNHKLGKWTKLDKDITEFFEKIKGINSVDPLAELERIAEEKKRQAKYESLLKGAQTTYSNVYEYIKDDERLCRLYSEVKDATTLEERQARLNVFNEVISVEIALINDFNEKRATVSRLANYIINNNKSYPSHNITKDNKDWARRLLETNNSITNYKEDELKLYAMIQNLSEFVKDYVEHDAVVDKFNAKVAKLNTEKAKLVRDTQNISNKFKTEKEDLISDINKVNVSSDKSFETVDATMVTLYTRYKKLLKKNDEYTSRKDSTHKYSRYRQIELNDALDRNDYALFDTLLVKYKASDSTSSYSSNSSTSSYSSGSNSSWSSDTSSSNSTFSDSGSSNSSFSDSGSSDSSWGD